MKLDIAQLMPSRAMSAGIEVKPATHGDVIVIELKYGKNRERVISGIKRVSKPGRRIYARKDTLPKVLGGLGTAIISTSRGLITSAEAQQAGPGWRGRSASSGKGRRMSRIGRAPIPLPAGVEFIYDNAVVTVKGPKGELTQRVPREMTVRARGRRDHGHAAH